MFTAIPSLDSTFLYHLQSQSRNIASRDPATSTSRRAAPVTPSTATLDDWLGRGGACAAAVDGLRQESDELSPRCADDRPISAPNRIISQAVTLLKCDPSACQ